MEMPVIVPKSPGGLELQKAIDAELRRAIEKEVPYEVLAEYIVVMLGHGDTLQYVQEQLVVFLGEEAASRFGEWVFRHVEQNSAKYASGEQRQQERGDEMEEEEPESGGPRRLNSTVHVEAYEDNDNSDNGSDGRGYGRNGADDAMDEDDYGGDLRGRGGYYGGGAGRRRHRPGGPQGRRNFDHDDRGREWGRRGGGGGGSYGRRSRSRSPPRGTGGGAPSNPAGARMLSRATQDRMRDERQIPGRRRDEGPRGGGSVFDRLGPARGATEGGGGNVFERLAPARRVVRVEEDEGRGAQRTTQSSGSVFSRLQPTGAMRMDADVNRHMEAAAAAFDSNKPEDMKQALRKMELMMVKMAAQQKELVGELKFISPTAQDMDQSSRSIVVQNVHFAATREVLQAHFLTAGPLRNVKIALDKATGKPKGYAFLEFVTQESAIKAQNLSGSLMLGRPIKVIPKEARPLVPAASAGKKGPIEQQHPAAPFGGGRGGRGPWRGGRGGRFAPSFGGGRGRGRGAPGRGRGNLVYVRPAATEGASGAPQTDDADMN